MWKALKRCRVKAIVLKDGVNLILGENSVFVKKLFVK